MALIPATLATASAADAPTPAAPSVTIGKQTTDPQKVRDFWTPERVARALANEKKDQAGIARDAAVAEAAAGATEDKTRGAAPRLTAEAPRVLPAKEAGVSATAAAADVPEMPVAEKVPYPQTPPATVVGKILYIDDAGEEHGCSGASIAADGDNTVWTAGHCVHPGDGRGSDGFYDLVLFIPGYKESLDTPGEYDAPWGEWVAQSFVAPEAWTQDQDYDEGDLAAFTVEAPAGYTNLTATVGALGYKFGYGSDWSDIIDSGFPGEGYNRTDMDGYTQFYCTGDVVDAMDWNPFDNRLEMNCDMGAGASGGPMATTEGEIVGANSHVEIDDQDQRINDHLYSSDHGDQAVAVINAINDAN
ncbi:trypsin-like serine peptidase [Streptomyces sp. NPDC018972]|uniref:trypsin-like serine peptidase n=1 Tax=Streptomyces sp. NPDC018972 TaxID=3365060 RepID=UPI0037A60EE3